MLFFMSETLLPQVFCGYFHHLNLSSDFSSLEKTSLRFHIVPHPITLFYFFHSTCHHQTYTIYFIVHMLVTSPTGKYLYLIDPLHPQSLE